jgi:hypothetical protein
MRTIKKIFRWIRFGKITEIIKAMDGGFVSEIEYRGRFNRVVGYWAYGSFDPKSKYKG